MSDELRPCPFCGGPGYLCQIPSAAGGNRYIWIAKCSAEEGCGVEFLGTSRKVDAIKEWNTRVEPLPTWTYCEDALPEENADWLVTLANQSVCRAAYSTFSNDWIIAGIGWASDENPVIAWQPLPAPAEPKEAK